MNIRFLAAFYWVAQLGSVTRAAEKLSLTQAGISSRIAGLEAELGIRLFDRRDRRLTISPAGQRLLPHAEQILFITRDIRRDLDITDPGLPILRLGTIETIAHTWLVPLLGQLGTDLAETELELTIENTPFLENQFRRGLLDVAILATPAGGEGIRHRPLPALQMVFVRRTADRADRVTTAGTSPGATSFQALARERILTFQRGSPTHGAMMDLFRAAGCHPLSVHGVSSLSAMLRLLDADFGVATLPRVVVAPLIAAGRLELIETPAPLPSLPIFVIYRIDPSSDAIESVVETILQVAAA